jgi:hypothetical protein
MMWKRRYFLVPVKEAAEIDTADGEVSFKKSLNILTGSFAGI